MTEAAAARRLPAMNRPLSVSIIGGVRRSGPMTLPERTTIVTGIGGADLDLTEATLPAGGARLFKASLVGGLSVVTSADVRVEVSGFSIFGGKNVERLRDAPPDAPVLRISSWALVGGVRVRVVG
jgi:predicted membrane protein